MASTLCVKIITVILIALIITSYVIEMIEGHKAASKIHVAMGPIVSVRDGKVRPRLMESRFDKKYYGFLGIPYAAPPTTFMRFQVRALCLMIIKLNSVNTNSHSLHCSLLQFLFHGLTYSMQLNMVQNVFNMIRKMTK